MHEHSAPLSVVARSLSLACDGQLAATELGDRVCSLLLEIASGVPNFIGHLKVLVDAGSCGHCLISATSPDELPRVRGEMSGIVQDAVLTLNFVCYTDLQIDRIVDEAVRTWCSRGQKSATPSAQC